jgi:choline dehydrogenase-like flavoprotein
MSNGASTQYDVVIIGAGVSGNLIAKQLGLAGKKVLILEAGLPVPDSREEYVNNFYLALAKTPESPYPALAGRTGSTESGRRAARSVEASHTTRNCALHRQGARPQLSGPGATVDRDS